MLTSTLSPAGMRILVTLLLDTLPMLGNVLLLCFFVFFIFGIVGVQLWAGLLRNRCFLDSNFARCKAPPPPSKPCPPPPPKALLGSLQAEAPPLQSSHPSPPAGSSQLAPRALCGIPLVWA